MIVTFDDYLIKTQSGKDIENGIVYCSYKNDTICYTRKYVKPKTTAHNREYGAKLKKISLLYKTVPDTFKESLQIYAHAYNKQLLPARKGVVNAFNIFVKALCNHNVRLTDLDSLQSVVALIGGTVNSWIEKGLLQRVKAKIPNVNMLTETMQMPLNTQSKLILQTLLYIAYINGIIKPFPNTTNHAPLVTKARSSPFPREKWDYG